MPTFRYGLVVVLTGLALCLPQVSEATKPGDIVRQNGIEVEAPPAGSEVEANAEGWGGSPGASLTATTDMGGNVTVTSEVEGTGSDSSWYGNMPDVEDAKGGTLNPCTDTAYGYMGGIGKGWASQMKWWWTGVSPATGFLSDLKEGGSVMTQGIDNCGYADKISITQAYQGIKTGTVNISSTAGCNARGGSSGVGTGALPAGYIAYTCIWRNSNKNIVEADVKFNTGTHSWGHYRFFAGDNAKTNCKAAEATAGYGLDSKGNRLVIVKDLMAHERGHSFGLAHFTNDAHFNLTMSAWQGGCTTRHETLGRGDVAGMRSLY
jgi:hypothetical protein